MSLFIQFPRAVITAFFSNICWAKLKAAVVLVMIVTVRAATMGVHKEDGTEPNSSTCEPTRILCVQLWEFCSEL